MEIYQPMLGTVRITESRKGIPCKYICSNRAAFLEPLNLEVSEHSLPAVFGMSLLILTTAKPRT